MALPLPLPSREVLAHYFAYDRETGALTWRVRPCHNVFAGDKAGTVSPQGYLRVMLKKRLLNVHRIVWKLETGEEPPAEMDHINGNPADNRLCNLRAATHAQNQRNKGLSKNNACGFKGVRWDGHSGSRSRPWRAAIRINGKRHYLGKFATPEEAHAAYQAATIQFHGAFARAI